ncbi:MAG TPA: NAD-dependent epimerase/dehydratase family protein [Pyrinomonadaceae bacterium]|jgi:GDP-L-fucose synthase|nr:NAD-dependent epimerase/dehydratase family protein [Pyrinomonadaceae bacterium]
MKKILVTGGSGLVGRHLKEILPEANYISSKDYDLRSEADVKKLCEQGWDHIVHLAARVGGIIENINFPAEFIEQNLLMNTLLLKYARLNEVPRLTAILSTCIYPDVYEHYPLKEVDLHKGEPQKTNFAYAIAKRSLAVQIDAYNKQYQTKYNYLIPCNLFGEYDKVDEKRSHYLTALLGKIIKAEREGKTEINLLGTGKPLRQFMYGGDLARTIKHCIDNDINESFNVAVSENRSIREIAEIALKACEHEDFELVFDQTSPDGQFRKDVSNARMRSFLPDFQFTPLQDGIKKVYQYYKANNIV